MKVDPGISLTIRNTIFTGNEGESEGFEVRHCALCYTIPGSSLAHVILPNSFCF